MSALISVFFGEFLHCGDKKFQCEVYECIFWKKCVKVAIFWEETSQKLPYLGNEFLEVARTKQGPTKILFYQLTSTPIYGSFLLWMIISPLIDKIGKKNPGTDS
jgi:hypothetical protein